MLKYLRQSFLVLLLILFCLQPVYPQNKDFPVILGIRERSDVVNKITKMREELEIYERAHAISHVTIAESFSNKVNIPGVTTLEDVRNYYWQRATYLGLRHFGSPPIVRIKRPPDLLYKYGEDIYMISRRDFLKSAAVLAAASLATGSKEIPTDVFNKRNEESQSQVLFFSEFVPDGYSCKLAFVADHHYWPNHSKNWGGGTQQTRHTGERMLDLIKCLNTEALDVSVHGGDVIDSGSAFHPPLEEYIKQLDFEKSFLNSLNHHAIPMVGNHEVPDALYEDESELRFWKERFGQVYRFLDVMDWRLVFLNTMLPNPGEKHGKGNLYGIDKGQLKWLAGLLTDATLNSKKVLLFSHVSPLGYMNLEEFDKLVNSYDCVKGIFCGHGHKNYVYLLGKIPVMMRIGNVMSPMGYTIIYPYPDGRIVVVQKSQHFPFLDFVSSGFRQGAQRGEIERYFTLGGTSYLPLKGLKLIGNRARARIKDGHLRLDSGKENQTVIQDGQSWKIAKKMRATILIDIPNIKEGKISFSAVMEGADRMGVIALAESEGRGGIEAVISPKYSGYGQLYIADNRREKTNILDRSWFNIRNGIAYKFVLEVQKGKVIAKWKNMPELTADIGVNRSGRFGFFVENGTILVTDLKLEKVGSAGCLKTLLNNY